MDFSQSGKSSRGDSMGNEHQMRRMEKLFRARRERRQELAKLPFEKKILILAELQKMAQEIRHVARGTKKHPWEIR